LFPVSSASSSLRGRTNRYLSRFMVFCAFFLFLGMDIASSLLIPISRRCVGRRARSCLGGSDRALKIRIKFFSGFGDIRIFTWLLWVEILISRPVPLWRNSFITVLR
jgi:hypothetical protein